MTRAAHNNLSLGSGTCESPLLSYVFCRIEKRHANFFLNYSSTMVANTHPRLRITLGEIGVLGWVSSCVAVDNEEHKKNPYDGVATCFS